MRLNNVDLNLIVPLQALLEERHVTRAGQRIGLTQPAMSDALARLRRHFGDELLLRKGNQYELTPLGSLLRERVGTTIDSIEGTFRIRSEFHPADSDRRFTLYAGGNSMAVLIAPLLRRLHDDAPRATLTVRDVNRGLPDVESMIRSSDGVIASRGFAVSRPGTDLYKDRWVLMSSRSASAEPLSTDEARRRPWVSVYDPVRSLAHWQLVNSGVHLRTEVTVDDFLAVPLAIADSDRVALVPARLASRYRDHSQLMISPSPFPLAEIVESLWWHASNNPDPGHAWFRRLLATVGRDID